MKYARSLAIAACAVIIAFCAGLSHAAEKTFVVMPFSVNAPQSYKYLGKAVPGSIMSQLNRPGTLEGKHAASGGASLEDARRAMKAANADYAIWGVVNVIGNNCAIETHSVDKSGKTWSHNTNGPISGLTGTVNDISSALASQVMGLSGTARPAFMSGGTKKQQAKSDIIINETGQQNIYLNPQFRYQGAGASDGSRMRSQRLKYNMVDMAVGDFNGDRKNEIAILGEHTLYIYVWPENGQLKELGKTTISAGNNCYSMRAIDLNRDGTQDLVISTYEDESNRPYTYFYTFKGNKFSEVAQRTPYFASVMKLPPTFMPTLVGQAYDSVKLFAPGVHLMVKNGNKYALGTRLDLPQGANVFNVAWIPADKAKAGDLLVMLTDAERIKIFQGNSKTPIHTTMENFSGSATGMVHYKTMPGLGIDKVSQLPGQYYAPMRMIAADIGNTGENVLLLNKPISTASQFFDRYRFFPQGEIHALFWDGVGMALKWKTRRIRGSVAEIDLADVNNDGILDLVVGLNSSPELGIGSRQCMVTAYPLDVMKTNPNTPADLSDFEVNPN